MPQTCRDVVAVAVKADTKDDGSVVKNKPAVKVGALHKETMKPMQGHRHCPLSLSLCKDHCDIYWFMGGVMFLEDGYGNHCREHRCPRSTELDVDGLAGTCTPSAEFRVVMA